MIRKYHKSELAILAPDVLAADCLGGAADALRVLIRELQVEGDGHKSCLFIWEEQGSAVGYVGYTGGRICWLSVEIRPRRLALARVLLRYVLGMMEQGSRVVMVCNNPEAVAMCAAEGFLLEPPESRVDGRHHMQRLGREGKCETDRRPIGGELCLRPAILADMAAAARLHQLSFFTAMPAMPKLHTAAEDLAFYTDIVFPENDIWIAEAEGFFLGFIVFNREMIEHLYISPSAQGRGLGRILLGVAQYFNDSIKLWTFQENHRARTFYESLGFKVEKMTSGEDNEEKRPDILYKWRDDWTWRPPSARRAPEGGIAAVHRASS